MADAKGNFHWQQTSSLEALIININRTKNSKLAHPDDFNPYARREKSKANNRINGKAAWDLFKQVVINTMEEKK